jgi:hypothetical protein
MSDRWLPLSPTNDRLETLKRLDEERRALQPESDSPILELQELEELEEEIKEQDEDGDVAMDSEDEDPIPPRQLRRADDRAAERRKKLEDERRRKEKAEADKAKKPTKEAKQLEKVLKEIEKEQELMKEYEAEIATLNNDLREADCPRTRVLGVDRFWNRYYWFERNAMPYAGLPTSSTADAAYANGCVWVQGPDEIEEAGFIKLTEAENTQYRRAFLMSVPERKLIEEGQTHTFTAQQWGYYSEPDELDKLIAWLDVRGIREAKLRKELQAQRDNITLYMEKRKEYLAKHSQEQSASVEPPAIRVSTRTKTYVDRSAHRFMAWTNGMALRELGHLHSEAMKAPRKGVARAVNRSKVTPIEDEPRQTRSSTRQGKPLGRQGTRYNF